MPHSALHLPFVRGALGKPPSLWVVAPTGDWAADCRTGLSHADALLTHISRNDNHPLLGLVAREIGRRGSWSGVEAGFYQRISERASG